MIASLLSSCGENESASGDASARPAGPETQAAPAPGVEQDENEGEGGGEPAPLPVAGYVRCVDDVEPAGDPRLEQAAAALFGAASPSGDQEACQTPVYFAAFEDESAALITMTGTPGTGCHGCSASLSFHSLAAAGDGYVVLQSYPQVVATGTFGDPGVFTTLRIRNMNAVTIEHGGMFQGCTYGAVDFVLLGDDGPFAVEQQPKLCLDRSDGGARAEDGPNAVEIEGAWRVNAAGDGLIITQKSGAPAPEKVMISTWRFAGDTLALDGGDYPGPMGSKCW